MLRVAYIGNFRYPFTTENHIARTLQGMGVAVLALQEDQTSIADIEAIAVRQDVALVLYTRTWQYDPNLTDVWRRLEARGIKTASYHLDLYFGLAREDQIGAGDPFWTTQYVFTPDGDPDSEAKFSALGIDHHWMPPAIVEDEAFLGTPTHRYTNDVAFVGMAERYHPEWPYRQELLAWLRERYAERFWRVGHGGNHGIIRGPHLNDLYASVNVVVGDSLCPGFTKPGYWSDRPYETVGRGGFLIMPDVPGLEAHFTHGEHLQFYTFGDFQGLGEQIDYAIANRELRDEVRRKGHAHVLANHTYRHRLTEALKILELQP